MDQDICGMYLHLCFRDREIVYVCLVLFVFFSPVWLLGWIWEAHIERPVAVTDADFLGMQATAVVSKSALISETPAWNSLKVGEAFSPPLV
jgi:hypothetical protein